MKLLSLVLAAALLPAASLAQTAAQAAEGAADDTPAAESLPDEVPDDAILDTVDGLLVLDASEADLDAFLWQLRPLVVFANTPADPAFEQQMRAILDRANEFLERDVVVIIDTDPSSGSAARQRLRPRGFMLAIIDKDGEVKQRRPAPRSAREIMAVIDRFPLRRQEMLERRPSGRD
ncbi:MAG: DUF4174 domain-containing protein [Alkalilacustris sp.]